VAINFMEFKKPEIDKDLYCLDKLEDYDLEIIRSRNLNQRDHFEGVIKKSIYNEAGSKKSILCGVITSAYPRK
jgi:hypothetical protein